MNPTFSTRKRLSQMPAPLPPLTADERHAIYMNLLGTMCVCGGVKKRNQSLCRSHYFQLPYALRSLLWASANYPETFVRACRLLKLQPPKPEGAK